MDRKSCLMIGAGGWAGMWLRQFLPPFSDRLAIAGLVDADPAVLGRAGDLLVLAPEQRFSDMRTAFERTEADFCVICVPPAYHKQAVELATTRRMHILSEKPIADSWEACLDTVAMVRQANIRMAVIQNYRYTPRIMTLKKRLEDGQLGRINTISCRFAADYTVRDSWGKFRHEIPHSLLIEGAVHHFDQIRNLAGADCARISGKEWNPAWSSFDGACCALFVAEMANGVMAHYEGSCTATGEQHGWHQELYRVECEGGALSVGRDNIVRLVEHIGRGRTRTSELEPVNLDYEGHQWIIDAFLRWLDGGPPPPTALDDNIRSAAMLFGAIEASASGTVVDVQAKSR